MSNTPPECFGKSWEATAKECVGGFDEGFTGPNGSHVRDRCDWLDSCKVRVGLAANNARAGASPLIPTAELMKKMFQTQAPAPQRLPWQPPTQGRPVAPTPPPTSMTVDPQQLQMQMMQMMMMAQQAGMMPQGHNPFMSPSQMHTGHFPASADINPIRMMPMAFGMPAYLSVPENREEFWPSLGRELLRGMGKALGHSLANFFDTVVFKR